MIEAPYWWDAVPPADEPARPLPARRDAVVVGGGIGGLCAALELARGGAAVSVLEADAFGFNAAARNSGGVSFGLDLAKAARWARWTGRKGPGMLALAQGALESLTFTEDFIARNAIDCDYHRCGRLVCATTSRKYGHLARRAEALNRLFDPSARLVPAKDQDTEIGSDRFHGVLVIERSGQLEPARYVRGLMHLCDEAGVSRHARTTVTRIERAAGGFRVATSAGALACGSVVAATNAHSARLPSRASASA